MNGGWESYVGSTGGTFESLLPEWTAEPETAHEGGCRGENVGAILQGSGKAETGYCNVTWAGGWEKKGECGRR